MNGYEKLKTFADAPFAPAARYGAGRVLIFNFSLFAPPIMIL
jgi:hypothetical protein